MMTTHSLVNKLIHLYAQMATRKRTTLQKTEECSLASPYGTVAALALDCSRLRIASLLPPGKRTSEQYDSLRKQ